jgi:menaquinone-dependent protoporphyrinogen IX oxidase
MAKPRVLVTYASKMGSTKEIAEVIGRQRQISGMQVSVAPCNRVSPEGFDAEHATGPLSKWMSADSHLSGDFRDWDRIRAWASDIAHSSIRRQQEGSSDGAAQVHRR